MDQTWGVALDQGVHGLVVYVDKSAHERFSPVRMDKVGDGYLWCDVPQAEPGAAGGDDEVDGMVDGSDDGVTDELYVVGDDVGVKDPIATGLEEADHGRPRPVQKTVG